MDALVQPAPFPAPPARWRLRCRSAGCCGCRRSTAAGSTISSRNRRGYWSLVIFTILFVLSLGAEFIANDRPILASYKGELLLPWLHDYPEDKFGGFLAQTDYRDPVVATEIEANGWMVWPPIRYSYNTHQPRPAGAGALAADLDADGRPMQGVDRAALRQGAGRSSAAGPSNGTGSAPTTRAATSWPGSSTASASRSCSG